MPHLAVVVFAVALCAAMLPQPSGRTRRLFLASFLGLLLSLIAQSTPRSVGDAREYVVMAVNLAHFERPSLTPEQLATAGTLFTGEADVDLSMPQMQGLDGRQDFPHFWFYSLLAAPFVGPHPFTGFTTLNVLLLLGLALLLLRRVTLPVALLVVAGPILWWVDKAHTEVLTFSLITIALVELRSAPWWSIVAFGVGALQNPPLAGAMVLAIVLGTVTHGWRDRRIWLATAAGAAIAALHPLYFYSRLRVWSGLYESVDRHLPSWRELFTVAFDPNLGIFVHDPLLLAAMVIALVEAVTRPRRQPVAAEVAGQPELQRSSRFAWMEHATLGLIALLFLLSFTQTTNFNSGGTPGPGRYGLWLVPFAVPILASVSGSAIWLRAIAASSVLWCVWAFSPDLPEQYLRPTTFAADVWHRWPGLDNPVAEVFAERVTGHERARPPVATAGCDKVLLSGDGSGAEWPSLCTPAPGVPPFCQIEDALCYANRDGDSYSFVPARASPAWRVEIAREDLPLWTTGGRLAITQTSAVRLPMAIQYNDGWSYPEYLSVPSPDVVYREWRWIGDRAGIWVTAPGPVTARVKITARALGKPRRLRVSIGDLQIATLMVGTSPHEYRTPSFTLPDGTSTLVLESLDGTDAPGPDDARRLSVAVFQVEIAVGR